MALPHPPLADPPAGSTVRYNAHHGAQILDINATTAEFRFYAATSPKPTLIDCFRIKKGAGGANTYEDCRFETFSLLTGGKASDAVGTSGSMNWRRVNRRGGRSWCCLLCGH